MLFSKKKPNKPEISNEKEFVVWVLKNLDAPDMKMVRKLFPRSNLDGAINSMADNIVENLRDHEGRENLMDFLVNVHDSYKEFRRLIEKRGGFWRSPEEVRVAFF